MTESTSATQDWFDKKVILPAASLMGFGLLLGLPIGFFLLWLALYKLTLPYLLAPIIFKLAFIIVFGLAWGYFWRPRIRTYTRRQKLAGVCWILIFTGIFLGTLFLGFKKDPQGRRMMGWIASWSYPIYKTFGGSPR
jgi:FtsH-binding integral membrane protein